MGKLPNSLPNSEILLLYEAKLCNPNGDPDEENKPRIDPKTNVNLVSDVRLKRFFRDYIVNRYGEKYVYVTRVAGLTLRADQRIQLSELEDSPDKVKAKPEEKPKKEELENLAMEVPVKYIDARLFGATVPIGGEERGAQKAFIGPVQFTWGFSLHPVELVESSTITSVFAGRAAEEQYGTMGKDWRLYYSLIAFYGVVSGRRAAGTGMTEKDLEILDDILWMALVSQPTTRSKIGERPHLYLRVQYKDADTLIGDLRRYIKADGSDTIRDLKDVNLDFSELIMALKNYREKIDKIFINCSEDMKNIKDLLSNAGIPIKLLPHGIENELPELFIKGA